MDFGYLGQYFGIAKCYRFWRKRKLVLYFCGYRLIGKLFVFQTDAMGSSPIIRSLFVETVSQQL